MVYSAVQLIRTRGVAATGLREIVATADAPRGSLQHYFPGGKEQLVGEAIGWAGRFAAGRVEKFMATLDPPTPSGLFAAMVGHWRREFTTRGYDGGCPVAASTTDAAGVSDRLREAASAAFLECRQAVREALHGMGVPEPRAESLAVLMISALEGALMLARAHRDTAPLDIVVDELTPLLDGAVRTGQGRSGRRTRTPS
jgi:AcrR family transcriptional regulator